MNLESCKEIAEELFSGTRWTAPTEGFCECPGQHTHTTKDTEAKIYIRRAPTIKCVHNSCADIVADENRKFRRAVFLVERDAGEEDVDPAILEASRQRRDHLAAKREEAEETSGRINVRPEARASFPKTHLSGGQNLINIIFLLLIYIKTIESLIISR